MKKLLIISYWYPPRRAIGAVRIESFVRHLPDFGWKPYVVTVAPDADTGPIEGPEEEVCRTKAVDVQRLIKRFFGRAFRGNAVTRSQAGSSRRFSPQRIGLKLYDNLLAFPDSAWPWYFMGRRKALRYAMEIRPDAILSSSPPETSHVIASYIQKRTGVPWIADLRDLWSNSAWKDSTQLERRWMRWLERKVLKNAAALCTVTPHHADELRRLHDKTSFVVTNGFEPDEVPPPKALMKRVTMLFTGMLYPGKRDPALLFEALRALVKEGRVHPSQLRLAFCGPNHDITLAMARSFGVHDFVHSYGSVSRKRALELQQKAHVLLQLEWNSVKAKGGIPGKFFEYLGSGRPILAIGPKGGILDEILQRAGMGNVLSEVSEIKAFLRRSIEDPSWSRLDPARRNLEEIMKYTRARQAGILAENLLKTIL